MPPRLVGPGTPRYEVRIAVVIQVALLLLITGNLVRLPIFQAQGGSKDVFVHISAVEQAGLSTLNEGQAVEYELESNRGKESAVRLKVK